MATDHTDVPPIQHIPTAKEKKYDRQLRLWAAAGQAALEDAHILLINAGSGVTGIEALKNLILPSIGQFTIQDSTIVSEADLGVNFFLEDSSIGKPRAQEVTRYLLELNPDVTGHAIAEPLAAWISSGDVLAPYSLVLVASPIRNDILQQLTTYAITNSIPLLYVHSVGFYSSFSVNLPTAFPIVDTHPDPAATTDIRLLSPWPELSEFAQQKTNNIDSLSAYERGHIPYILLLLHYLDEWRATHNGASPVEYKDKNAFRDFVRSAGPPEEENYAEAYAVVLKTLIPPTPSAAVISVLSAHEAANLTSTSAPFWYIASAISTFISKHKELPLPGSVPDMKAQSSDYIVLQNIYKKKARSDVAEVLATVRDLERQHGKTLPIDPVEVEQFCKLAAHVKLLRGSSTPLTLSSDPLAWSKQAGQTLISDLGLIDAGLGSSILVYVAFVAYDAFLSTHVNDLNADLRAPGQMSDEKVDEDAEKLTGIAYKVLDAAINATGTTVPNPLYDTVKEELRKICVELTRAAGGELHNIASLTGGLVAQEIIKIVTRQYVPVDNVCVFDGVSSKTGVYRI